MRHHAQSVSSGASKSVLLVRGNSGDSLSPRNVWGGLWFWAGCEFST